MTLEEQGIIRIVREYREAIVRLASLHAEAIRIGNLICDIGRIDFRPEKISNGQFNSAEQNTETLRLLAQEMTDTNSLIHRLQGLLPIGSKSPSARS